MRVSVQCPLGADEMRMGVWCTVHANASQCGRNGNHEEVSILGGIGRKVSFLNNQICAEGILWIFGSASQLRYMNLQTMLMRQYQDLVALYLAGSFKRVLKIHCNSNEGGSGF